MPTKVNIFFSMLVFTLMLSFSHAASDPADVYLKHFQSLEGEVLLGDSFTVQMGSQIITQKSPDPADGVIKNLKSGAVELTSSTHDVTVVFEKIAANKIKMTQNYKDPRDSYYLIGTVDKSDLKFVQLSNKKDFRVYLDNSEKAENYRQQKDVSEDEAKSFLQAAESLKGPAENISDVLSANLVYSTIEDGLRTAAFVELSKKTPKPNEASEIVLKLTIDLLIDDVPEITNPADTTIEVDESE